MRGSDDPAELRPVALPSPRRLAASIVRHLAEAVLAPLVLFYVLDALVGLWPALAAAAAWTVGAIVVYFARGGRPSALLVASAGLAALQIVITAATRSPTVFFLQPTLATYVFAGAMLVTARRAQPLIRQLALDVVPLPADVLAAPVVRRFFVWLSLVWAAVLAANATLTLVLLLTLGTTVAVPLATVGSAPLLLLGIWRSYRGFRRAVRVAGFRLVWEQRAGA